MVTLLGKRGVALDVHEGILWRSPLFQQLCTKFRNKDEEMIFKLKEWDIEVVSLMVQWTYTNDYDSPLPEIFGNDNRLVATCTHQSRPQPSEATIPKIQPLARENPVVHESKRYDITHGQSICHAFNATHVKAAKDGESKSLLKIHVNVYLLAEYAQLPELQHLALQRFQKFLSYLGLISRCEDVGERVSEVAEYEYRVTCQD